LSKTVTGGKEFPEGAAKCRNCEKYGILENILNAGEFVNVRV
jgi:hypothetical protein